MTPPPTPCPYCRSPDTAKYIWPDDAASRYYLALTPEVRAMRICLDCRKCWQP